MRESTILASLTSQSKEEMRSNCKRSRKTRARNANVESGTATLNLDYTLNIENAYLKKLEACHRKRPIESISGGHTREG